MNPRPAGNLLDALGRIPDPRGHQGRRHPLSAMLAAVVCAVLCGARGYRPIVQWLHLQDVSTWHWLGFLHKPPTRNCFRDLLMAIPPEDFEEALRVWLAESLPLSSSADSLSAVSLDGKTLCGTLQTHRRAVHLLSILDQTTGCVLSQCEVDQKTNEAKASLDLLKTLVLEGRVVTGDAMFCQREVCEEVLDAQGHYLFVVKENQPTLLREITAAFGSEVAFSPLRPAGIR